MPAQRGMQGVTPPGITVRPWKQGCPREAASSVDLATVLTARGNRGRTGLVLPPSTTTRTSSRTPPAALPRPSSPDSKLAKNPLLARTRPRERRPLFANENPGRAREGSDASTAIVDDSYSASSPTSRRLAALPKISGRVDAAISININDRYSDTTNVIGTSASGRVTPIRQNLLYPGQSLVSTDRNFE